MTARKSTIDSSWCGLPRNDAVAPDQLEPRAANRASAPSAYREGNQGGPMGQGESSCNTCSPTRTAARPWLYGEVTENQGKYTPGRGRY